MALGYVRRLPERDYVLINRSKFESEMAATLGGRAAEDIVFEDVTDGAADDLEKATKMARSMVTQYGMSDKLGPIAVRAEGGADLPGTRDRRAAQLLRVGGQRDRPRGTAWRWMRSLTVC
jgi:cell division protease FtsH